MMKLPRFQPGFTLLELTVALLILIALAGVVLPFTQGTVEQSACQATDATLMAVKEAIMGSGAGPGYYSDLRNRFPYYRDGSGNADCHDDTATGGNPRYPLHFLFNVSATTGTPKKSLCPKPLQTFHPNLALGWRGPYLQSGGGKLADPDEFASAHGTNYHDTTNYVSFDHSNTSYQNDIFIFDHFRPRDRDGDGISSRNPLVLQVPSGCDTTAPLKACEGGMPEACARLVSAGPDGILETKLNDCNAINRGDDRVLFLRIPDPLPQGNQPCVSK